MTYLTEHQRLSQILNEYHKTSSRLWAGTCFSEQRRIFSRTQCCERLLNIGMHNGCGNLQGIHLEK